MSRAKRSPCPRCHQARLRWLRKPKVKPRLRCTGCRLPLSSAGDMSLGLCRECYPPHATAACQVAWPGYRMVEGRAAFAACKKKSQAELAVAS